MKRKIETIIGGIVLIIVGLVVINMMIDAASRGQMLETGKSILIVLAVLVVLGIFGSAKSKGKRKSRPRRMTDYERRQAAQEIVRLEREVKRQKAMQAPFRRNRIDRK